MTIFAGRRAVLLGLGLTALSACGHGYRPPGNRGTASDPGDAGDGKGEAKDEGEGGGAETREDLETADANDRPSEGGVGGTGIVGTLNGFGSLLVNGLRIATPSGLTVSDAFGERGLSDLALGQALTIEAANQGGALTARRVAVTYPLIGTIEQAGASRLRCLGVTVAIEPGAPLLSADGAAFIPATGDRVAVSGHWRRDRVVATRIDRLASDGTDVIAGTWRKSPDGGLGQIGGLEVMPSTADGQRAPDSFVTALGRRDGPRFIAEKIVEGRFTGAAGPLVRLSIEGYLETVPEAPGYAVSGLGHSFDSAAKLSRLDNTRAVFLGPYEGTFKVSHGLPLPRSASARRAVLAELDDPFAPKEALSTR